MTNLYSTGQAAKMFGCSIPSIKRWVIKGNIYCVTTLGGQMKLSEESITQLKEAMNFKDEIINELPQK